MRKMECLRCEVMAHSIDTVQNELKTLRDLANSGKLFFRFSQSCPGRSIERVYAEYIPGKITEAADDEKYLSFVSEDTIAMCFLYGDMLTKLVFDLNDNDFIKIADTPFKYLGNAFGEYESRFLLVEQNYSLEDVNTIVMLFDYVKDPNQLRSLFIHPSGSLDQRLHDFGYFESEALVKYLKIEFYKNIHISPEEIRCRIKKYLSENGN